MPNQNRLDERDDYKMIDRAAGVAFSNLQKPVVPVWVNKEPITDETRYWPVEPETFNGLSAENRQYILDLQEEADGLRSMCLFLGGLLVLFTVVAVVMYRNGWIVH